MTKRKMADRKVLQLLYLLYDVCKDCLEEFFKYNCLHDDPTDEKLTKYVIEHKNQLFHHLRNSCCHTCANNQKSCAQGSKKLFQNLFTFPEDFSVSDANNAPFKKIKLNDLDIWTVQYLLLADNLEPEHHKWIKTLYEKRHAVSLHFETISDDNFESIWNETRDIVLDILRSLNNRQYEKAVGKQLSLLKMTGPELYGNEEYWCMMQKEFNIERRPHLDTTLPTPGFQNDTEMDENINNNFEKSTVINIQAENFVVGHNNVINNVLDPAVKRELEAMIENRDRVLLEKIGQMYVVAHVKNSTKTYDETIKSDIHNDGIETGLGQRATSSSCTTKERKDYRAVWKIKTKDDTDKKKLEEIAKYIEQTKVIDENITIEYVQSGSIIIGTLISANAVEHSDLFDLTIRRFIRMIIKKCKFNTKFEHVLKVDVTLTPSSECIKDTEISVDEEQRSVTTSSLKMTKSHEKSTQTNDLESRLEKTKSDYVKMYAGLSTVNLTESMMSKRVDTIGNRTFYEKVDEKEILYAEFPLVKIKALANYTHTVDEQQVVMMKKDQIYFLIKQVGDWWEITDNPGPSFFVKSKCAVIITPDHVLSPVRKQSIRHDVSSAPVHKHHAGPLGGADSNVPESDYDTIPGDTMDVKARLRKTISGEQIRHHDHAPLRKAQSEAVLQHSKILKRQPAVYYAEHQDSSGIALTPLQKTKAFRKKRAMSVPSQDTHSDPFSEDEAEMEVLKSS
ncbi:uncharacterized protein LOC134699221 [Mytilus trossulus]|uniref:uncharacterized protein LOC134699221 n=1 Tax=Mytilus trossulus TaxID=6551 RepID=UPI0030068D0F